MILFLIRILCIIFAYNFLKYDFLKNYNKY